VKQPYRNKNNERKIAKSIQ